MRHCYFVLLAWLLAHPFTSQAQDANYWSAGYGPAGFFMPGSVIAQNRDSGVLFYNPALLATTRGTTSSLTGTIYQWQSLLFENGLAPGHHLRSRSTSIVPMVASHAVPFLRRKLPFTLAYAIVHTPVIDYNTSQEKDAVQNVLDDTYSPGAETFIGQYKAANRIDHTSFQLAAGMEVTPTLSVGITLEGFVRKQQYTIDYIARALMNPAGPDTVLAPITTVAEDYSASYHQTGFRAKIGAAWSPSAGHHLGLLITTPVWKLTGRGTIVSNVEVSNLMIGNTAVNLLASTRQTRLSTHWKNPLSIAAAYTYMHQRGQLYLCAEYFAPVKPHSVVAPGKAAFVRPDTSTALSAPTYLQLLDGRKAIVNVGIGGSYQLNEAYLLFASVRTDFSYDRGNNIPVSEGYKVNVTNWDLYHAQLGVSAKRRRFHVRAGLLLTYGGNKTYQHNINLDNPDETNFLLGTPTRLKAQYLQAGALVSYIHNF